MAAYQFLIHFVHSVNKLLTRKVMYKQLQVRMADFNIWNPPIRIQNNTAHVPISSNHVFTCLKQKGIVKTLTPTMLFTTFMIRPQFDAVILALRQLRSLMSRRVCAVLPQWPKMWLDAAVLQLAAMTLCGDTEENKYTSIIFNSTEWESFFKCTHLLVLCFMYEKEYTT